MSLSAAQHAARAQGIGGSEAAVALGLSPYMTPVELWMQKTGRVPPKNLDNVEHVQWGSLLEDTIAEESARRIGVKLHRVNNTVVHAEHRFLVANPDRRVVGQKAGFEAKNASQWTLDRWGESGTDDVPLFYLVQCVQYMAVLNYDLWYLGALLGGNELRIYKIERDLEVEANIIAGLTKFWDCVTNDTPPKPVNMDDLVRLYPKSHAAKVANEQIAALVAEGARVNEQRKELEKREKEIKLEVGAFLGAAGDLLDPFDSSITIATYRSHDTTRIDAKLLRQKYPDIAAEVEKTSSVRTFLWK